MNRPKKDPGIYREQIRQLYDQSIVATIGSTAAASIIATMFYGTIDSKILLPWAAAAIGITILRYITVFVFNRLDIQSISPQAWERRFILLVLSSGIIWGASGIFLFPQSDFKLQMILLFILVAMCAGASETFSAVPAAFFTFAAPCLTPIILRFIIYSDHAHAVLGYVTLIFFLAISMYTLRFYRKTIQLIDFKFANLDLIEKLAAEKTMVESMNKNLRIEISERMKTEDILSDHKKNLEKIVTERTLDLQEANTGLQNEINEKRRAEKALKKSEEKYRLLVENANDAICIFQNGKIKFHNRYTEIMLGYSPEELAKMGYFNLFHPDEEKKMKKIYSRVKKGAPIPPGFTMRLTRKDGETLWVLLNGIFITWEERPALLAVFRDVTRQRHLEKQLIQSQKMEAIGNLASGIAHDINNILGGIEGNVSMLLRKKSPDEPDYRKLADIETYIKSGSGLTRQLLGFARPAKDKDEGKNEDAEITPVDITAIVDETVQIFARAHRQIRVIPEYEPEITLVDMNIGQIQQVFLNLMVNASHAMPDGGTVYINTKKIYIKEVDSNAFGVKPGKYIRISVTDTGCGIDESIMSKIFDPFFTTKSREKGTGLGLYTAYRIIKKHGGHITVYSEPKNGATFNIYLPASLKQTQEGKNGKIRINPETRTILTGSGTILLVEDEPDILDIGKEMIEALGYTAIPASTGNEAIAEFKANSEKIDMVILDLILPDMNGENIFTELKKIKPDVRVLLASGFAKNGRASALLDAGCMEFIQKPYNISQLSSAIRKII